MKTISLSPILKGNMNKILLIVLLSISYLAVQAQSAPCGSLTITFTDIRSDIGEIVAGIYSAEEQWIYEPEFSQKWSKEELKDGTLKVEIPNLPYGTYAISVLDDEDKNAGMKYFVGLPREGWGMSTNPSFFKLKAPSYEECAIELDCSSIGFEINMNYLNKRKKVKE
jgi:uncharacterized protein (DUF2141 family)